MQPSLLFQDSIADLIVPGLLLSVDKKVRTLGTHAITARACEYSNQCCTLTFEPQHVDPDERIQCPSLFTLARMLRSFFFRSRVTHLLSPFQTIFTRATDASSGAAQCVGVWTDGLSMRRWSSEGQGSNVKVRKEGGSTDLHGTAKIQS